MERRPRPRVTWFLENTVVDDSYESRPDGITVNHLTFPNIGRQHLHARLVCQAVNTHLANPTSKVVVLDINRECSYVVVKPISVKILTQESQISADRRYEVECRSSGSRPEAIITWWKGSRQIKRITKNLWAWSGNRAWSVIPLQLRAWSGIPLVPSSPALGLVWYSGLVGQTRPVSHGVRLASRIRLLFDHVTISFACVCLRTFILYLNFTMDFIDVRHSAPDLQVNFSEDGGQNLSILTFVPVIDDDGKYLTCRAENPSIPESALEDKWRLNVHCVIFGSFHLTMKGKNKISDEKQASKRSRSFAEPRKDTAADNAKAALKLLFSLEREKTQLLITPKLPLYHLVPASLQDVMRMEDRMTKKALQNKEKGIRPIGRPRTRWIDQAKKDMEDKGAEWRRVTEGVIWKDRQEWKRMCQTTHREGVKPHLRRGRVKIHLEKNHLSSPDRDLNPDLPVLGSLDQHKTDAVANYAEADMPVVNLKMGSSLNPDDIKEGDDVYFECNIRANPKAYRLAWFHNGHEMHHNVTGGVILSDQSLVLQGVTRQTAGEYTCLAANTEGKGTSNPVTLRVMWYMSYEL
uniref:Ig-like domain-containing protein n=1 Tax=Timema bartmani TaxID=61472 RepID=A0A7R9ELY5_9NEOP|nr:unnamed protein product [Timema bartmani]